MGPETPLPRKASPSSEKIPNKSLSRREGGEGRRANASVVFSSFLRRFSSKKKKNGYAFRVSRNVRLFARAAFAGKRPFVESTAREKTPTHLKTLHLLGPNAQTWLDASSMLMNRLRASFHLSCPESGFKGSFPAPPFCVRPCFPKRWIAERMGPAHPLAQRARVTGSHALSPPSSVKGAPFKPSAGV